MKLYYAPGTCALGIHILLEEIGKPYELASVDFSKQAQFGPEFTAINPKSKVPVLERDDGSRLTQYPAIATWLALSNPDKKLLRTDPEGFARTLEFVDYICSTVHMQAWVRFWRTNVITPNEADHPAIKARGKEMFEAGLRLLDGQIAGKPWAMGDFSIADPTLFFVSWWGAERMKIELPKNVAAHYERMRARPSVQAALKQQGLLA